MRLLLLATTFSLLLGCGGPSPAGPAAGKAPAAGMTFARDIQPLLSTSCLPCHSGGPDAASRSYDLSRYEGVMGCGTDSIPNVIPGNPDSSKLHQSLEAGRMPPSGRLDAAKIGLVRSWIAAGARND